jgi:soluble cytochrome b562
MIALSAFVAPTIVHGQAGGSAAPGAGAGAAAAGPVDLGNTMNAMNRAFRGIRGQVTDASKNSSSLDLVLTLQRESVNAKSAVPPMLANLPEAEKTTKVAAYRKEMNKLIRQELDLEDQLLSGDNTKANEAIQAIAATMNEGHGEFRPPRGGGRGRGGAGGAPAGGAPPAQ